MSERRNKKRNSVRSRWIKNVFLFTAVILLVLTVTMIYLISARYYHVVELSMKSRSSESFEMFFNNYSGENDTDLNVAASRFVEGFRYRDVMDVWVIDKNGTPVMSSGGYEVSEFKDMPDYYTALKSETDTCIMRTTMPWNEPVMAQTYILKDKNDNVTGAVRYLVSLKAVNRQIYILSFALLLAYFMILLFIANTGAYFVDSIVNPVKKINETAARIASGDFSARIDSYEEDDEIGQLCDTINNMAEQIGEADKMKNDFISTVSHEIRTPLTAIKGWGETLADTDVNDSQLLKKGLGVIINETSRLSVMVEELLDFSRIQDGRLKLKTGTVDVIAEIQQAYLVFVQRAEKEQKSLTLDFDPQSSFFVSGDNDRICQVFVNILDNAIKYTDIGGIIRITVEKYENYVRILVSDNGCGIAKEDMRHVKDKFYKANNKVRGTGIGLAVVDEIVRLHGGSLTIESQVGKGTDVTVLLPLIQKEV
ncbi:MAG: sensor histidine kinase [Acutalibacteraceae bacterium]